MLYNVLFSDMLNCLRGQRIAFIGDEKMKRLFLFFAFSVADKPRVARDNQVDTPLNMLNFTCCMASVKAFIGQAGLL